MVVRALGARSQSRVSCLLAGLIMAVVCAPERSLAQVINACVTKNNGSIRILSSGTTCKSTEYLLSWNIQGVAGLTGPAGPIGPAGPQGPAGSTGPQGPAGTPFPTDCPADSVLVGTACIDKYEASVWQIPAGNTGLIGKVKDGTVTLSDLQGTSVQQGATSADYTCNVTGENCNIDQYAASVAGVAPARFVTWFQAQQFCRASGKRLVTNAEWQAAAAGTPNGAPCITQGTDAQPTGTVGCISNAGAFDMVGNVAEWVADWAGAAGSCGGLGLFGTGQTDCYGGSALVRGGFFFSQPGALAGVFNIEGEHLPTLAAVQIGFRCAR